MNSTRHHRCHSAIAIALGIAATFSATDAGLAQSVREPSNVAELPVRLGPVGLAPRFRLSTAVDNNILNDPLEPKEDLITTIAPETRAAMRLGRARLEGQAALSAEQYRRYRNENSLNFTASAALGVSLNRLLPYAEHSFVRSRERQGFEIDTRPLRTQHGTTFGLDVRVASKLTLEMSTYQATNRYNGEELFRGTSLQQALDRDVQTARFSIRHPLSALTALVLSADWTADRFPGSPQRNAESLRLGGGLAFKPTALVAGGFNLSYTRFMPIDRTIEQFRGLVTTGDLAYTLLGVTRFGVLVDRHIDYSYDAANPYYVVTGGTVSITQRLGERWSIWGNAGRHELGYLPGAAAIPSPTTADGPLPPTTVDGPLRPPTDVSDQFVAGVTMQFRRGTELVVSAERSFRYSSQPTREFQDTRARVTLAHRF